MRSDADRETLSPRRNPELFAATIGGLGLTGIITEATIRLAPIASAWLDARRTAFHSLEEYFALAERAAAQSEHTVAWIDCLGGGGRGRGIFQQADWCADGALEPHSASGGLTVPFDAPGFALNGMTMRAFNELYFRLQAAGPARQRVHYAPFFYPLDALGHWNRLYGRRGFYQYQCVLPPRAAKEAAGEILSRIARARAGSFLAVIKTFGDVPARGLLSFARPGTTLALDFPNKGPQTLELMNALDAIVRAAEGALYPAKDARMPRALFESGYPDADRFKAFVDPAMSSDFWSRVTS